MYTVTQLYSPGIADSCRGCCSRPDSGKAGRSCSRRHPPPGLTSPQAGPCWWLRSWETVEGGHLGEHGAHTRLSYQTLSATQEILLMYRVRIGYVVVMYCKACDSWLIG